MNFCCTVLKKVYFETCQILSEMKIIIIIHDLITTLIENGEPWKTDKKKNLILLKFRCRVSG